MEEEFCALLLGAGSVSALVGSRVNWGAHPQGEPLPAIVLTLVDDIEGRSYTGPNGLSQGRVQVDCYAATYRAAKSTARAVRSLLDGYRGGNFEGVFHAASREGREGGTNEADRPYRCSLDFMTNWRN